jgi:TonB-dependent SusC/RagA subfamily outer membrane receptor
MKSVYILFLIFLLCISSLLYGQKKEKEKKITISGFVTDSTRKPVAGGIILIDNKKTSTLTDEKGAYKIKVSTEAGLLSVFTLKNGMVETRIDGRSTINIIMSAPASTFENQAGDSPDDETVNVGYGIMKKKDTSDSGWKTDGTNNKYASYQNIYDLLRGEVTGIQVSGTKVMIQGPTSFYLSSDPLFIVDGIAVSSIDDITPRFVKSVQVLKGAAASIYGSRGTNGVILIYMVGAPEKK